MGLHTFNLNNFKLSHATTTVVIININSNNLSINILTNSTCMYYVGSI